MSSTTSRGYTYPASTDHVRLWEWLQQLATDINTDTDVIAKPPFVRLVQQSSHNLNNAVWVPIQFGSGSEEADTHGYHSEVTNITRITPTRAGWYRVTGTLWLNASTALTQIQCSIAKNGSITDPVFRQNPNTANQAKMVQVTTTLSLNGSGDYVELHGQHNHGSALATSTGVGTRPVLELKYERGL